MGLDPEEAEGASRLPVARKPVSRGYRLLHGGDLDRQFPRHAPMPLGRDPHALLLGKGKRSFQPLQDALILGTGEGFGKLARDEPMAPDIGAEIFGRTTFGGAQQVPDHRGIRLFPLCSHEPKHGI